MQKVLLFIKDNYPIIKNKYFLTISAFIIWIAFFDENSLWNDMKYKKEIRELQNKIKLYKTDINENIKRNNELKTNNENLEKFAREQYKMKKEKEVIYIIQ